MMSLPPPNAAVLCSACPTWLLTVALQGVWAGLGSAGRAGGPAQVLHCELRPGEVPARLLREERGQSAGSRLVAAPSAVERRCLLHRSQGEAGKLKTTTLPTLAADVLRTGLSVRAEKDLAAGVPGPCHSPGSILV